MSFPTPTLPHEKHHPVPVETLVAHVLVDAFTHWTESVRTGRFAGSPWKEDAYFRADHRGLWLVDADHEYVGLHGLSRDTAPQVFGVRRGAYWDVLHALNTEGMLFAPTNELDTNADSSRTVPHLLCRRRIHVPEDGHYAVHMRVSIAHGALAQRDLIVPPVYVMRPYSTPEGLREALTERPLYEALLGIPDGGARVLAHKDALVDHLFRA